MIALSRLFEIWFADRDFSVAEVLAFTGDHLGRLTANNPLVAGGGGAGEFDLLITQTAAAYQALGGTTTGEAISLAVRKARTFAKTQHLQLVRETLSQREGLVRNSFKKKSFQYVEFYPGGLTEYAKAREAELKPLLERYLAATVKYIPAMTAEFQALLTTWNTLYSEASEQAGTVSGSSGGGDAAMTAMQRQLMRNALTLALHFLGQVEMEKVYFNQSKLENAQSAPVPPVAPVVPPAS